MATPTIDYNALAAEAGAVSSTPAQTSQASQAQPQATPKPAIDYNALAKQAGATSSVHASPPAAQQPPAQEHTSANASSWQDLTNTDVSSNSSDLPLTSYGAATRQGFNTV